MTLQLLAAYREYSGRGVDFDEDIETLGELVNRFPKMLIPIPFFLFFLLIAYLILERRESVKGYDDRRWFYTNDGDNGWYKTLIIFGWISGVLCILPAVVTGLEIVWRVIVGGALTIVSWIISWALSIFVLFLMVGFVPMMGFLALAGNNKVLAVILGLILLCGTLFGVISYWDTIMDWSFMFPPLEFDL